MRPFSVFPMVPDRPAYDIIGCSHATAPLEVREALALTPAQRERLQLALGSDPRVAGAVVIQTCNRVEIHACLDGQASAVLEHLAEASEFPVGTLRQLHYHYTGARAVEHLFALGAGLESEMIGETEILGQLKLAYRQAHERKPLPPLLHRVFQKAFQAAKWARTHTAIGEGQVSMGSVAVELAQRIFGRLESSRCLVVGTGEVGRETAKALASRGVKNIALTGRTLEHVRTLADEVKGRIVPFDDWLEHLREVDILICATAAPSLLLHAETVRAAMKHRPARPLFVMDLAVPRDVESRTADLDNVFLYLFTDLAAIANEHLKHRHSAVDACRTSLAARARDTWMRLNGGPVP